MDLQGEPRDILCAETALHLPASRIHLHFKAGELSITGRLTVQRVAERGRGCLSFHLDVFISAGYIHTCVSYGLLLRCRDSFLGQCLASALSLPRKEPMGMKTSGLGNQGRQSGYGARPHCTTAFPVTGAALVFGGLSLRQQGSAVPWEENGGRSKAPCGVCAGFLLKMLGLGPRWEAVPDVAPWNHLEQRESFPFELLELLWNSELAQKALMFYYLAINIYDRCCSRRSASLQQVFRW